MKNLPKVVQCLCSPWRDTTFCFHAILYQPSYRGCAIQLLLRSWRLGITVECQPGCGFSLSSLLVFSNMYSFFFFLFLFLVFLSFPSRLSRLYTGAKHENVGALMSSRCHQGAHGVVVSHPLSMREAPGSIPGVSILLWIPQARTPKYDTCGIRTHAGRPHRLSRPTP